MGACRVGAKGKTLADASYDQVFNFYSFCDFQIKFLIYLNIL